MLESDYDLGTTITEIVDFVDGPQREKDPDSYASHTPGDQMEDLTHFSTTIMRPNISRREILESVLKVLAGTIGIVIEFERVITKIDYQGNVAELGSIRPLKSSYNTRPLKSKRYEIHFGITCSPDARVPSLNELRQICAELEIIIGGWFKFRSSNKICYRSNGFTDQQDTDVVARQREQLESALAKRKISAQVKVTCEEVLGVWNTSKYGFVDANNLAEWEQRVDGLKEFWVVLSNFLGDRNEQTRSAMIWNLSRGVKYAYFLNSHADIQRLAAFVDELADELGDSQSRQQIKAYVIHTGELGQEGNRWSRLLEKGGLFISNPLDRSTHRGFEIAYHEHDHEIRGHEVLSPNLIQYVDDLIPIVRGNEVYGEQISLKTSMGISKAVMAVCFQLHKTESLLPKNGCSLEELIQKYDGFVSKHVSKRHGQIQPYRENGYSVFFEDAIHAWHCMLDLQRSLDSVINSGSDCHSIGIDCGVVSRFRKSYGLVWEGDAATNAHRLALSDHGVLLITSEYKRQLERLAAKDSLLQSLEQSISLHTDGKSWLVKWQPSQ